MYPLIAKWTILAGTEQQAVAALQELAKQVEANEPDTLMYLVHTPDMAQLSFPTPSPLDVVFYECYTDHDAFIKHLTGPIFTQFVATFGSMFLSTTVTCPGGGSSTNPFVLSEALTLQAGFVRGIPGS